MDAETIKAWQSIFRDVVITLVAAFMLIYETVVALAPNPYLIGAGLTLLGVPPALRLDRGRGKKNGSPRTKRDDEEDDDVFGGPGGYFKA